MKLRHAKQRAEACHKREAKAACVYGRRVRETEKAEQQYRQQRRAWEDQHSEDPVNAALSLWEGRGCVNR